MKAAFCPFLISPIMKPGSPALSRLSVNRITSRLIPNLAKLAKKKKVYFLTVQAKKNMLSKAKTVGEEEQLFMNLFGVSPGNLENATTNRSHNLLKPKSTSSRAMKFALFAKEHVSKKK